MKQVDYKVQPLFIALLVTYNLLFYIIFNGINKCIKVSLAYLLNRTMSGTQILVGDKATTVILLYRSGSQVRYSSSQLCEKLLKVVRSICIASLVELINYLNYYGEVKTR